MGVLGDIWDIITGNAGDIAVASVGAGATKYAADQMYKGTLEQNTANALEAKKNREFQSEEARINRDWQENMSSTALTRKIQDAKNAGINPIAALGATGASSGPGAMVSGAQAHMANAREKPAEMISKMVNNAVEAFKGTSQARILRSEEKIKNFESWIADVNARVAANSYDSRVNAEIAKNLADEEEARVRRELAEEKGFVELGRKKIPIVGGMLETRKIRGMSLSYWSELYQNNREKALEEMQKMRAEERMSIRRAASAGRNYIRRVPRIIKGKIDWNKWNDENNVFRNSLKK